MHPPYSRILAKAFQWFWVEEFESSVHLAAPKIEAAARALLLDANAAIYRTEVGDTDGHFLGLGALLPLLCKEGFDPDWERFFRTLLLSEGMNMRNLIAHGFVDEADEVDAALILRACACMLTLPTTASVNYDGTQARDASTHTPSSATGKTD